MGAEVSCVGVTQGAWLASVEGGVCQVPQLGISLA